MNRHTILGDCNAGEEYEISLDADTLDPYFNFQTTITFTIANEERNHTEVKNYETLMEALMAYQNLVESLRNGGAYYIRERQYGKKTT